MSCMKIFCIRVAELLLVPRTGLEPVLREEEDFKSSVSTIPPPGRVSVEDIKVRKDEGKAFIPFFS
jgi:hypothetical protein